MKIKAITSKFIVALCIVGFYSAPLYAQTIDDLLPDFTPEEQAGLGNAFGTYTSAVVVFTGRNAASTGNFEFDNNGGDLEVINVPLSYTSGNEGDEFRYRARGSVGYMSLHSSLYDFYQASEELKSQFPDLFGEFNNQPDFRKDEATSLTLGGSVVYEPIKGLKIEPGFDFIWTHVKRRFDYNNFLSAFVGTKYDRDVFNNSTEAITYSPNLGLSYLVDLCDGYSITPSVSYSHLWSNDLWSKSQYANFDIDSGVLKSKLEANIPLPFSGFGSGISVRPFTLATSLFGAVKNALDESTLYEFGGDLAFPIKESFFTELRVGAAYITASDLSGYRFNVAANY